MPTVSVIIPTHNRPQLLARALASVASQTFRDFEIVVVQNGGNRDSEAVAQRFQQEGVPIRYIYESKPDPTHARNIGIQASQGKYVAFLDDDDEWLQTKLERQVAILNENAEIGLVVCNAHIVDNHGNISHDERANFSGFVTLKSLIIDRRVIHSLSCVLMRRACFEEIGLFNLQYPIANDYDLYLRLVRGYRFLLMEQPLVHYSLHPGNMTLDRKKTVDERIAVLKSLWRRTLGKLTRRIIRIRIARYGKDYYALAVINMDAKRYRQAARLFLTAVRCNPRIGAEISWSRFTHPTYRLVRPYLAIFFCELLSFTGSTSGKGLS